MHDTTASDDMMRHADVAAALDDMDPTKERLIVTAERLFAELGIAQVTVRQINEAAGQRNTSAIYYHFGCKQTFISAIFEYRLRQYDRALALRLDRILADGRDPSVRELIDATYRHFVENLATPGRWYYARFSAQFLFDPQVRYDPLMGIDRLASVKRVRALVAARLTHLPEPILRERLRNGVFYVAAVTAEWTRRIHQCNPAGCERPMTAAELVGAYEDLIDCFTAALEGPARTEETSRPGVATAIGS